MEMVIAWYKDGRKICLDNKNKPEESTRIAEKSVPGRTTAAKFASTVRISLKKVQE
jgi:hypothetical protein